MRIRPIIVRLIALAVTFVLAAPAAPASASGLGPFWCGQPATTAEARAALADALALLERDDQTPDPADCPDCPGHACCGGGCMSPGLFHTRVAWSVGAPPPVERTRAAAPPPARGPPLGVRAPPSSQSA